MEIFSDLDFDRLSKSVATIGMFDGLHKGHRTLLNELINKAKLADACSVVITFWPHPRVVLHQDENELRFLTSVEEKCLMLNDLGVDYVLVLPFTLELAQLTTEEFIAHILVDKLAISHLVVGYNHRFGKGENHQFSEYQTLAKTYGFGITKVDSVMQDGVKISSTQIRNYLSNNLLDLANEQLGYNYTLKGMVVYGNQLGRRINYPTANIQLEDNQKLIPSDGVYACQCHFNGKWWNGMVNIGVRPTISNNPENRTIEAHLFDFKEDIYNQRLEIALVKKMREEQKFNSIEELKAQLAQDETAARTLFENK